MINETDIITHIIESEYIDLIISNTQKASIGGRSQIRSTATRQKNLSEDQLVGQISTYCGSVILTGSNNGYIKAREIANNNPYMGDEGIDIVGIDNVDIKGSLMRRSQNPLDYRLLVRPKERHNNWIYVLGLVPKIRPYQCHLVGWASDNDLPKNTYNGPIKILHGAYVIDAKDLNPITELISNIKS